MIQILTLLMPVAGLAAFVGFVWLVVRAFHTSTLWGVLVLILSPFSAVIYAIRHWHDAKKPFLVYSGSTAAGFAMIVMMFAFFGGFDVLQAGRGELSEKQVGDLIGRQMDRMENSGMLDEKEQADLNTMKQMLQEMQAPEATPATVDDTAALDEPAGKAPATANATAENVDDLLLFPLEGLGEDLLAMHSGEATRKGYVAFRMSEAKKHIGDAIKVVDSNGQEWKGRLDRVGRDGLTVIRYLPSGTITFEFAPGDVRSLYFYNP